MDRKEAHTVSQIDAEKDFKQLNNDEAASIEIQIAELQARISNAVGRARTRPILLGMIGTVFGIGVAAFGNRLLPGNEIWERYGIFLAVAFVAYGIVGGLYLVILIQNRIGSMRTELEVLKARQRILNQFKSDAPLSADKQGGATYFDSLVRINVDNLAEYYALVKAHTDKSFLVSIAVGSAGFAMIIAGLIFGFIDNKNAQAISYIASGAGIMTEFIAGVFFYLYNRTVRQMKGYHDSLLTVQNVLLSFKIVGDTKDEREKVKMVGQMLAYLVGKGASDARPAPSADESSDK